MATEVSNAILEGVDLIFRNFSGNEQKYNAKGMRNFSILLDPETADRLEREGWNIKTLKAREEGDVERPYIQVNVAYKVKPPRIFMVTSRGKTPLLEDMVEILDVVDIKTADVILNPYPWVMGDGSSGIKAYLKTMYVTIDEDPLDLKYAELEDKKVRELEDSE